MLLVNDFPVIRILQGICSKLPRDLRPDSFHQSVADPDITQHIIRCHAGLPAIQIFSEHDPPGRQRDLCRSIHDAGAFPAEFKDYGCEELRRLLHYGCADRSGTREENEIEAFAEECFRGALRALRDRLNAEGLALDTLSMGMSDDFPIAIEEGSTMVRIGSSIFGKRMYL
jgi:hypothetical protein